MSSSRILRVHKQGLKVKRRLFSTSNITVTKVSCTCIMHSTIFVIVCQRVCVTTPILMIGGDLGRYRSNE